MSSSSCPPSSVIPSASSSCHLLHVLCPTSPQRLLHVIFFTSAILRHPLRLVQRLLAADPRRGQGRALHRRPHLRRHHQVEEDPGLADVPRHPWALAGAARLDEQEVALLEAETPGWADRQPLQVRTGSGENRVRWEPGQVRTGSGENRVGWEPGRVRTGSGENRVRWEPGRGESGHVRTGSGENRVRWEPGRVRTGSQPGTMN